MLVLIANLVSGTHCGQSLCCALLFTVPLTEPVLGSVLYIVCSYSEKVHNTLTRSSRSCKMRIVGDNRIIAMPDAVPSIMIILLSFSVD